MVLSADADAADRDISACAAQQGRDTDLAVLTDLLAGPAGAGALSTSRQMIARHGSLDHIFAKVLTTGGENLGTSQRIGARLRYLVNTIISGTQHRLAGGNVIAAPDDLFPYLQLDMAGLEIETFRVFFLDSANHLLADHTLWRGTVDKVQAHPREIIRHALAENASALILVHNHPSGDTQPSHEDLRLTREIAAAASLMGIALLDHIIVGRGGSNSLRRSCEGLFARSQEKGATL